MPKGTEEEKQLRIDAIQAAIKNAAHVSLKVAEYCIEVMEFSIRILEVGNPNAASESGASGIVAYSGVHAAIFTVNINLASIKDQQFVTAMQVKVKAILDKAQKMHDQILAGAAQVIS
jgi:glutamate formiminotransferase/formiminotetrahydrofolate cyclodeaminase